MENQNKYFRFTLTDEQKQLVDRLLTFIKSDKKIFILKGYAITCHKAQESEWPEVFIHLEKSMFFLDKENQYRWAYTALSRAEQKVHILNNICLY